MTWYRSNIKPGLREYRWVILITLGILTLAIGYIGFEETLKYNPNIPASTPDKLYYTIQLLQMKFPLLNNVVWYLHIIRFAAPFLMVCTFYLIFASWFLDHARLFLLKFTGDHVVICGMGYIGPVLAQNFYDWGYNVVVIEKDPKNKDIELFKDLGAIVLINDATKREVLKSVHVENARFVFAVTGDDGVNSEIATLCKSMARPGRNHPLRCFVHVVDDRLFGLLKVKMIGNQQSNFRLDFFNIYQRAGFMILKEYPPLEMAGDASARPDSGRILVIGLGRMGESLIVHATEKWKKNNTDGKKKLKFTIIDFKAADKKDLLGLKYPLLKDHWDIDPVSIDLKSSDFVRGDYLLKGSNDKSHREDGKSDLSIAYICLDDSTFGLAVALQINKNIEDLAGKDQLLRSHIPIIVRTIRNAGIAKLLQKMGKDQSYKYIKGFPIVDRTCGTNILLGDIIEDLAQAVHREYVQQQQREGVSPAENSSMVDWERLPEELKESNRLHAAYTWKRMQEVNCGIALLVNEEGEFAFTEEEIEYLAEKEHERWMGEKISAGYRYGPEKSSALKTHPCLLNWEQLPEKEKNKDRNTIRTLPSLLTEQDLKIIRFKADSAESEELTAKQEIMCGEPSV